MITLRLMKWTFLYSGLAGTILVYKIAGASAQRGGTLDRVESLAKMIARNVATIGVGLEHCHVCSEHHPSGVPF